MWLYRYGAVHSGYKNMLQAVEAFHVLTGEYGSVTAATALVVALLLFHCPHQG